MQLLTVNKSFTAIIITYLNGTQKL